jgi:hypothetical protein
MLPRKEKTFSQQSEPTLRNAIGRLGNKFRIIIICKIAK